MKKLLLLLLSVLMIFSLASCNSNSRPTEYQKIGLDVIGKDVSENLGRATNEYVGNCYQFKVKLSYISKDLERITAYEIDPAKELGVMISGNLLDKEDKDIIMNANDGDIITIKGKITDISLGFMISAELKMDIYEISINN